MDYPLPVGGVRRRADLAFPALRIAVFVDGCFWHRCPIHATYPRANAQWWEDKLNANAARDQNTDARLAEVNWVAFRVWEHEDARESAERLRSLVRTRREQLAKPPRFKNGE
ncbi:DNA mismatch endonuclease Vsr [Geodermatophilus bullaregiensis]|nr:DNA mismatch endonuclease Vsr [Geodermatophilus bullaregiensis]